MKLIYKLLLTILVLVIISTSTLFLITPKHLKNPSLDHQHLRLKLLVNGKRIDFGSQEYQKEFDKSICDNKLSSEPFHFHDNLDQYLHLHWKGLTGGDMLTYLNINNKLRANLRTLAFRFDYFPQLQRIRTLEPKLDIEKGSSIQIYFRGYQQEQISKINIDMFKSTAITDLNKKVYSAYNKNEANNTNVAYAHEGEDDSDNQAVDSEKQKIESLLGDFVIVINKEEIKDNELKQLFTDWIDIPESVCGG